MRDNIWWTRGNLIIKSLAAEFHQNISQVYQYCKVDPRCVQGTEQFQKAKCDVRFMDLAGRQVVGCSKSPTPSVC